MSESAEKYVDDIVRRAVQENFICPRAERTQRLLSAIDAGQVSAENALYACALACLSIQSVDDEVQRRALIAMIRTYIDAYADSGEDFYRAVTHRFAGIVARDAREWRTLIRLSCHV